MAGPRKFQRRRPCAAISKVVRRKDQVLKVAIIGCGKIADSHAAAIQIIKEQRASLIDGLLVAVLSRRAAARMLELLDETGTDLSDEAMRGAWRDAGRG